MKKGITRRSFLKGGAAAGSIAAFAGLASCTTAASNREESSQDEILEASEETDADIVIVGSGGGGMSAAIEAGEAGVSTILLEQSDTLGGNFNLTGGIMGVNSVMGKEEDRQDPMEILQTELSRAQYSVDALKWMDLIEASGPNIQWLLDHGVEMTGPVAFWDPDAPVVYHEWSSPADAMVPAIENAGVQIMKSTRGKQLITDDDNAVIGIYAEKEDGSILKINCKAVILATGGWLTDEERMDKFTRHKHYYLRGAFERNGDGINMATAIGARSTAEQDHVMGWPAAWIEHEMGWYNATFLYSYGKSLWVNQDGYRFVDEGLTDRLSSGPIIHAFLVQQKSYCICDSAVAAAMEGVMDSSISVKDMFDGAIEDGEERIWRADTFEELFEQAGVDSETFLATVDEYNGYCENGEDETFGKMSSLLVKLEEPPYYMVENTIYVSATLGNLDYDRSMRVIDNYANPITGLYVAGVDGAQLYRGFYSLETAGGSCNANNVNSGRVAAQTAISDFSL